MGNLGTLTAARITGEARALGFDLVGIATLGPAETAPYFDDWVHAGYAGEMTYLPRGSEKRADTRLPFAGAASAIVVGMNYGGREPPGPVARYARGDDYHDIMLERLQALHRWLRNEVGEEVRGKAYVDTGPILERDLARRAGLGWFGKNTNLINPTLGSYFFIGALLVDLDVPPDLPFQADRCGTCRRCLDACPTGALVAPRTLDATRCIAYLTIELKGAIPEPLRAPVGELIYGCDICQEVCPWNVTFAQELTEPAFAPREVLSDKSPQTLARDLLAMTDEQLRTTFQGSPMKRAKLRGLKRNAAVVLGNIGDPGDIPALSAALEHPESLIRQHAAWALGRMESPEALEVLRARAAAESDPVVLQEIRAALSGTAGGSVGM